jgi:hypothetical protein
MPPGFVGADKGVVRIAELQAQGYLYLSREGGALPFVLENLPGINAERPNPGDRYVVNGVMPGICAYSRHRDPL